MPAVQKKQEALGKPMGKRPLVLSNKKFVKNAENAAKKQDAKNKGIMFIKHLPHGFYETQLRDFFEQFGAVTRVYVARSKKTLRSKGWGIVEFQYREVAQIAAESLNNYIMFGRIIKTNLLPASARKIPKNIEMLSDENGKETTRYLLWKQKLVKRLNGTVAKSNIIKKNIKTVKKSNKLNKIYKELGIDFDVSKIVPKYDPEELKLPEDEKKKITEKKLAKKKEREEKYNDETADDTIISINDTIISVADASSDEEDDEEEMEVLKSSDWDVTIPSDDSEDETEVDETLLKNKSLAVGQAKSIHDKFQKKKTAQEPKRDKLLAKIMENFEKNPKKEEQKPKPKPEDKIAKREIKKLLAKHQSSDEDSEAEAPKQQKLNKHRGSGIHKKKGKKDDKRGKMATNSIKLGAKKMMADKNVKVVKGKDLKKKKNK